MLLLEEFTQGYIEALLWAGVVHEDDCNDDIYDEGDISEDDMKEIKADCKDFFEANEVLLNQTGVGYAALLGHDFYLTRNGHGAGFWDRDYPGDVGDKLTELCKPYGYYCLEVDSDGKLYGLNG